MRKTSTPQWDGLFTLDLTKKGGILSLDNPIAGQDYHGDLVWLDSRSEALWRVEGHLGDLPFDAVLDSDTIGADIPLKALRAIVARYPHHFTVEVDQPSAAYFMIGPCDFVPEDLTI